MDVFKLLRLRAKDPWDASLHDAEREGHRIGDPLEIVVTQVGVHGQADHPTRSLLSRSKHPRGRARLRKHRL